MKRAMWFVKDNCLLQVVKRRSKKVRKWELKVQTDKDGDDCRVDVNATKELGPQLAALERPLLAPVARTVVWPMVFKV